MKTKKFIRIRIDSTVNISYVSVNGRTFSGDVRYRWISIDSIIDIIVTGNDEGFGWVTMRTPSGDILEQYDSIARAYLRANEIIGDLSIE